MENLIVLAILCCAVYITFKSTRPERDTVMQQRKWFFRKYQNVDNGSPNIYCNVGIDKDADYKCSSLDGCKGYTVDTEKNRTCYKSEVWPRLLLQKNVDYFQCLLPNANY